MKASILTLAAAAALGCGSQVAQAHLLMYDDGVVSFKSVSSTSALAVMTAAGIRYHAAANYKPVQTAKSNPARAANAFQVARDSF